MRRIMEQLVAVAALACLAALPAAGAEVHLTPGDDLQKALDAAAPGDTIVLKDGVYYQRLTIARGGTPGKPVTLKAATPTKKGLTPNRRKSFAGKVPKRGLEPPRG